MQPASPSVQFVVVVVVAVAGATLLQLTAPAPPDPNAAITALAVPRTVLIGERTSAYGAVVNAATVPVERRFGVCDATGCAADGLGEVPASVEWHGSAGAFVPMSEGYLTVVWLIAEGSDASGARARAFRMVVVEAMKREGVRDASD